MQGVYETLLENGGTALDTAPGYRESDEVAGRVVGDLGVQKVLFWATKVNVAARRSGTADANSAGSGRFSTRSMMVGETP